MWDDTRLVLSNETAGWRDLFTGRIFKSTDPLWLRTLFSEFPFAVLEMT